MKDKESKVWDEKAVTEFIAMWQKGLSVHAIASHFGVGKNSVLGKRHRLGLPIRQQPRKGAKYRALKRMGFFKGRYY